MEQLFFAGKAYLKINSLVKTPLHEFMAVERSGLWAPVISNFSCQTRMKTAKIGLDLKLEAKYPDSLKDLFVLQNIADLREIEYEVFT